MNQKALIKIIILGCAFMCVFAGFYAISNIEKHLLQAVEKENITFTVNGYLSLAIIYACLAVGTLLAALVVYFTGPAIAMVLGSCSFAVFTISFLYLSNVVLYGTSAFLGVGAAIMWIGHGSFLASCSDISTIVLHSGIFWTLFQCSLLIGNCWVYLNLTDKTNYDVETRALIINVLAALAVVGVIGFAVLILMSGRSSDSDEDDEEIEGPRKVQHSYNLKQAIGVLFTRDMMLLSVAFVYMGFQLAFFTGMYGTAIGFTESFEQMNTIALVGISIGAGEVLVGILFTALGRFALRYGRDPIIFGGYVVQMVAFLLIYLNLPTDAMKDLESLTHYEPPNQMIALACGFMLGAGDACLNTQCYSILGIIYVDNFAAAFSLYKFMQSIGAACAFGIALYSQLWLQLCCLVVIGSLGTVCFCIVEWRVRRFQNITLTDGFLPEYTPKPKVKRIAGNFFTRLFRRKKKEEDVEHEDA